MVCISFAVPARLGNPSCQCISFLSSAECELRSKVQLAEGRLACQKGKSSFSSLGPPLVQTLRCSNTTGSDLDLSLDYLEIRSLGGLDGLKRRHDTAAS